MKNLSIGNLRKLVLETLQEEKENKRIRQIMKKANVILEDANVADFRGEKQIPLKLSDVDSDVAEVIATSGQGDTDKIEVTPDSWKVRISNLLRLQ